MEKNIAVLMWGPVAWSTNGLSIDGVWRKDGPDLPVEYARVSNLTEECRKSVLSLALRPGWKRNPVLWSMMSTGDVDQAVSELAALMGCVDGQIGLIDIEGGERRGASTEDLEEMEQWSEERLWYGNKMDAIVWTARSVEEMTSRDMVNELRSLDGKERRDTEAYVRRTGGASAKLPERTY